MASTPSKWIDFKALESAPENTVAELCRIDLADLISTMELHPALYGFAAAHHESAKIAEVQKAAEVDRIKAAVFLALAQQDPTLPVNRLERLVETNLDYQAAVKDHIAAKRRAGALRSLVNGLEHRRDMIIQIASRQKHEMANG